MVDPLNTTFSIIEPLNTTTPLADIIVSIGKIALWIQGLGLIIVIWLIVQIVTLINNRKSRKTLYKIREDLEKLDKKIIKLEKSIQKL